MAPAREIKSKMELEHSQLVDPDGRGAGWRGMKFSPVASHHIRKHTLRRARNRRLQVVVRLDAADDTCDAR